MILKQVEEFCVVSRELAGLPTKAYFTMVCLDCEELRHGLINKANSFSQSLLKKLVTGHREENLLLVIFLSKTTPLFIK